MEPTEALIAEYDQRIATRFVRCQIGSSRYASRQAKIDAIVEELGRRADAGDPIALAWYNPVDLAWCDDN